MAIERQEIRSLAERNAAEIKKAEKLKKNPHQVRIDQEDALKDKYCRGMSGEEVAEFLRMYSQEMEAIDANDKANPDNISRKWDRRAERNRKNSNIAVFVLAVIFIPIFFILFILPLMNFL